MKICDICLCVYPDTDEHECPIKDKVSENKVKCPCGTEGIDEDMGPCKFCGEPVCEDCQPAFTIHSQIDFDCHEGCLDHSSGY